MYCFVVLGQKTTKEKTNLDKNVTVVDLDGTLMCVNTFHKWMQRLFLLCLKRGYLFDMLKLLLIIFLRAIKQIDHAAMKFSILEISQKRVSSSDISHFVNTLHRHVNHHILHTRHDGQQIYILATAAPRLYAEEIAKRYHFDYVIATENTSKQPWKENLKETKKENLLKLLALYAPNSKFVTLYTDHHDDLPLMKIASHTILVNPDNETLRQVQSAHIDYETIPCR